MITFKDIRDSIASKLSGEFEGVKVYTEKPAQGFNMPSFFVQIIPVNTVRAARIAKNFMLTVDIHYFPKNESYEELYEIAEKLDRVFKFIVKVKDRTLHVKKVEYQILDFVFHFQIDLDYLVSMREDVENDQKFELMREINFKRRQI